MRRPSRLPRLLLAAVITCVSTLAIAQSSAYKPGQPVMMWKVTSKTGAAYLLGSTHLADKAIYPLPLVITRAFDASNVLIVEVDMNKVDQNKVKELTMKLGMYPEGDSLTRHISPETRKELEEYLGGMGIPAEAFNQFRPWMAGVMIVTVPLLKSGMDPEGGIDKFFLAKAGSKRVEQVEDMEFQLNLLSQFPENATDSSLQHAIKQGKQSDELMAKMTDYWSRGEADKLQSLMDSMSADDTPVEKAFTHRLLEDRNPGMTAKLEECMKTDKCFMVVGAAHVIGKDGIVKQLQAQGYTVEQAIEISPEKPAAEKSAK